jgi:hypothetical protein
LRPEPDALSEVLPHGQLLVASRTSQRQLDGTGEPNATIYSAAGAEVQRFSLGDGLDDVQVTEAGEIWAVYSFVGTMGDYGRHGWGRIDANVWIEPIGGSGFLSFDLDGAVTYQFAPPPGFPPIMDAYALNVGEDRCWVCYHPGFPLVQIGRDGVVRGWRSGLWGVDAIAVSGERFVVHRLPGTDTAWAVGRLGRHDEVTDVEPARALLEAAEQASIERVVGRGSQIHVFTSRSWYRLDLERGFD